MIIATQKVKNKYEFVVFMRRAGGEAIFRLD